MCSDFFHLFLLSNFTAVYISLGVSNDAEYQYFKQGHISIETLDQPGKTPSTYRDWMRVRVNVIIWLVLYDSFDRRFYSRNIHSVIFSVLETITIHVLFCSVFDISRSNPPTLQMTVDKFSSMESIHPPTPRRTALNNSSGWSRGTVGQRRHFVERPASMKRRRQRVRP